MIDILSTLQVALREAGFTTYLISIDRSPVVVFEDEVVTGFGCVFDDARGLLERWKSLETSLLGLYAPRLRTAGQKAWNVYSVFLCASMADAEETRQVRWIEEDLERTRKLAACGLSSREEVMRALLPLMPLQFQPVLGAENVTERLEARISAIAPSAADVVLDEGVSPTEVVRLLGEAR